MPTDADMTPLEGRRLTALVAAVRLIDTAVELDRTGVNTVACWWASGSNPAVLALVAGWDWSAAADLAANPPPAVPLSQLAASGATVGQVATWNGSAWVPTTPGGGGGGGSPTLATAEVSLGTRAAYSGRFTVTGLSGLTVGKPVMMTQAVGPYTGKGTLADEAEMDQVTVAASVTAADAITGYWRSASPMLGSVKFHTIIGA